MPKLLKEPTGIAATVETLVRPHIEALGLRLWDVRFEKEGSLWFLKVLIDRDEPMDTDACEAASRAIDPVLDEANPIPQSYCLEVGSPGLGRRLTRAFHFAAMRGQTVTAGLYAPQNGRKEVRGALLGLEDGQLLLETAEGQRGLATDDVAAVRLCDDENLFGATPDERGVT